MNPIRQCCFGYLLSLCDETLGGAVGQQSPDLAYDQRVAAVQVIDDAVNFPIVPGLHARDFFLDERWLFQAPVPVHGKFQYRRLVLIIVSGPCQHAQVRDSFANF